ncbi:MAG: T9SS type A sorting domain-containing protein [Candidatus Eisenbacteria bacterium]|nr:T9SS type A sorting domain-containing protein [Candidatus Eisenbacteria bacterium]
MSMPHLRCCAALLLTFCLACTIAAPAVARVSVTQLTDDGAWCWFSDPRAVFDQYELVTGWITKTGVIEAASFDLLTEETTVAALEPNWEANDHDHPAILRLTDGRYAAFYCRHAVSGTFITYKLCDAPGDVGAWGARQVVPKNAYGGAGATYANPLPVPGQRDQYHLFWRGADWKPGMSTGTYDPSSGTWNWSDYWKVIHVGSGRPYVKFADDDGERIGICFTHGHPDATNNNVYYAEIRADEEGEAFYRADGTRIKEFGVVPLQCSECDTVFDREAAPELTGDNAWVWDVAFDPAGHPVVAYTTFPSERVHQYHWARFNGTDWEDATLVYDCGGSVADTSIHPKQHYYSGGIALDPRNPSTVYLSKKHIYWGWDIEQWKTTDGGDTWTVVSITEDNPYDNLRPVVPRHAPPEYDVVLWMHGIYDHYNNDSEETRSSYNYNTSILMWTNVEYADVEEPVPSVASLTNVPNPFREGTTIAFELPEPSAVDLVVYDVGGRRVRELLDGERLAAGPQTVSWDGLDDGGRRVASGVYFVRADVGGRAQVRRVTLVR